MIHAPFARSLRRARATVPSLVGGLLDVARVPFLRVRNRNEAQTDDAPFRPPRRFLLSPAGLACSSFACRLQVTPAAMVVSPLFSLRLPRAFRSTSLSALLCSAPFVRSFLPASLPPPPAAGIL